MNIIRKCGTALVRNTGTKDASEVTGYGELLEVTPSKMIANVLQDDVVKDANVHVSIVICSETSGFQKPLLSCILRLTDGALKM